MYIKVSTICRENYANIPLMGYALSKHQWMATWEIDPVIEASLLPKLNGLGQWSEYPQLERIATLRGEDSHMEMTTLMDMLSQKRLQHCMHIY